MSPTVLPPASCCFRHAAYYERFSVVICLKISTFVVSTTTLPIASTTLRRCDLLENIYLCGINNNLALWKLCTLCVVICLKISIFVVSTTTRNSVSRPAVLLWFAWKYLSLWYQQQLLFRGKSIGTGCDLLKNIYLCGINNNLQIILCLHAKVVICLKISTFVVSTTTAKNITC